MKDTSSSASFYLSERMAGQLKSILICSSQRAAEMNVFRLLLLCRFFLTRSSSLLQLVCLNLFLLTFLSHMWWFTFFPKKNIRKKLFLREKCIVVEHTQNVKHYKTRNHTTHARKPLDHMKVKKCVIIIVFKDIKNAFSVRPDDLSWVDDETSNFRWKLSLKKLL